MPWYCWFATFCGDQPPPANMARSAYSADEDEHQKRYKKDKKDRKDKKDKKERRKYKYEHHGHVSSSTECSTATSGTPGPSGPIGFGLAGPPPQPNRPWIYTGGTHPIRPPQPARPPGPPAPPPNQNPPYPSLHDPQPPRPPGPPNAQYWQQQNPGFPVTPHPYGQGYNVPQAINGQPRPMTNGHPNSSSTAPQPPHVGLNASYFGQSMPPPGTTPGPAQNQLLHQPPSGIPPSAHSAYVQPYPLSPNVQRPNYIPSSGWMQTHNPTHGQVQPPTFPPMVQGNGYGQQGAYGNQYNWRPYGQ